MSMRRASFLAYCAIGSVVCSHPARADAIEDFYKGNTISLIVSTGAGGVFDLTARTVAKYLPKHIPGRPAVIVKNMPGAGHMRATNFMATQAAKDGTVIALVNNGIPLLQALDGRGVRYDATKLHWLGSGGLSNLMTVAWHTSGVKTIEDVMQRELVTGATGVSSNGYIYPYAMNVVLGTKFTIVPGYGTSPEADLAMERGEVSARAGFSLSAIMQEHPGWIRDKKVNVLVQVGAERERDFADVPLMHELGKTPEQRQILSLISSPVSLGRPFFTAPDVPADRVAALRNAFQATMRDAEFVAEARQLNLDISALSGERVAEIVSQTMRQPADIIAKTKAAYAQPGDDGKPSE
jgi:tripartite-type tricarboxylate transporter receptor subunit TctC